MERKIILDLAVSLDGYIEGPNGEVDWCVMDEEMAFQDFLEGVDTIFYGRVSYDLWGNFLPGHEAADEEKALWEAVHSKQKYVFSRRPAPDNRAVYLPADIPRQVAEIKGQPGKDIWLYGGASLIASFLEQGLVDLFRLSVHPVLLGGGKPLFPRLGQRTALRLLETRPYRSGVTLLVYEQKS